VRLTIIDSARKRDIEDDDIRHAVDNAIRIEERDDDLTMFVGPTRSGQPWEIGVTEARDFEGLIAVHAMPARPKFVGR